MWPDGMHPRGGSSADSNTWNTWVNNTGSRFHNTWLDTGNYEEAFRGIPSKKVVNVFLDAGYTNTSWSSTFMASGIASSIRGLGLWGLSALFNKNKQPQQTATLQANWQLPFQNYFNNVSAFFKTNTPTSPSISGNINLGNIDGGKKTDKPDNDAKKPIDDSKKIENDGKSKPVNQDESNTTGVSNAVGINGIIKTLNIEGSVFEVGNNNSDGYPESFKVKDATGNKESGKETIYTYTYDGINKQDNNKPMYQVTEIIYWAESDKSDDITGNTFTINDGVNKGKEGEKGSVGNTIKMEDNSQKPTIAKPDELGKGTQFTWKLKEE